MAIYHASAKIISRSNGKSVVAAAAYRVGDKFKDERLGETFDYTKKQGVDSTIILAPDNAPDWIYNRERLWNTVEAVERRKDSQLAREFNIALPVELNKEQMKDLAQGYVQEQFVNRGMIADVAFHDLDTNNPHFHVLLTMRDITKKGFGKKNRTWNSTDLLVEQREAWANHVNTALERVGYVEEKIDHRTLVAQGITDRIAQVHLGPDLHHLRQEYIEQGNLQEFRDSYALGDLYETINEINRQLAENSRELEEMYELMATGSEEGEEIRKPTPQEQSLEMREQTTQGQSLEMREQSKSSTQAQNRLMNPNEPAEESNRDRERESTAESLHLTERLQGITDDLTSSSREAQASRRRYQSLAERLRCGSGEVRKPRESGQSTGKLPKEALEHPREDNRGQSPSARHSTQGLEKGSESRIGVSQDRDSNQPKPVQQQLSTDLGGGAGGQGANQGATGGEDRPTPNVETGRSGFNSLHSPELGLNQTPTPEYEPDRANQRTGEQHRNQAESTGKAQGSLNEQQRLASLQNLAVMATLIRLMEVLKEENEAEEEEGQTLQGEHYTIKANKGYQTVEMYALDGRGLILRRSSGQISGQLSSEDIERMEQVSRDIEQQLAYKEGQRQVERCMPVLARYLQWLGRYREENATRLLEFDPTPKILTYRSKTNPEDFLVAKRTQEGWEYLEGKLTPEREKAIAVDFERSLRQKEREKEREKEKAKERDKGFER